jgi:hypothetical protein
VFLMSGALGLALVARVFDAAGRLLVATATVDHPLFRRLQARFAARCPAPTDRGAS